MLFSVVNDMIRHGIHIPLVFPNSSFINALQESLKTKCEKKKARYFPQRKYAILIMLLTVYLLKDVLIYLELLTTLLPILNSRGNVFVYF